MNKNRRLTDIVRTEKLTGGLEKKLAPERSFADGAMPLRGNAVRFTRRLPRSVFWGVAALVGIFVASLVFYIGDASRRAEDDFLYNFSRLQSGAKDLKNFDTESAQEKFLGIKNDAGFGDLARRIGLVFGGAGEVFSELQNLAAQGAILAQEIDFLKTKGIYSFLNQGGDDLIGSLRVAKESLAEINSASGRLSSVSDKLGQMGSFGAEFYLPFSLDIERTNSFMSALLALLESDSPAKIVLMFQNPSEMRPAGGFLGSYGVITIKGGQLDGLDVHDVVDADEMLDLKIVPPKPLQLIAKRWVAADANWFFDFSLSAEKALEFLEASRLYSDDGVKFDGAVAISPKVVEDILDFTGPIDLKGGKLKLNSENFLIELQRQVQLSREKRSTYPKDVLREFAPAILARLAGLDAGANDKLLAMAGGWIKEKDLMVFFKNKDIESFVDRAGASGKVYQLSSGFNGDYLAIVDTNIGGGKTDIFVEQDIVLSSQINSDGKVSNHLVIKRRHKGNKAEYSWYKVSNQNYVKVFVPESARISNFSGGIEKKIVPLVNYEKEGYVHDSNIVAVEQSQEQVFNYPALQSGKEAGRRVFSTWSRVLVGKSTEIVFDYTHRLPLPPKDGTVYTFVFEKQAGTDRSYKFEINAPVGFRFKENGLPVFTYDFASPKPGGGGIGVPGRLVLELTLEEI